jgi:isopenicillin-N N-acyltransferase-like protein
VIDGCSIFAQKYAGKVWTSQNWDWISSQKDNLVHLYIEPDGKPRCHVLTEAGLVGKIGINEWGVTVNSNAIKATNLNVGKLPVQVMLRVVLEQICREGGLERIKELGVASVGHVSLPWW